MILIFWHCENLSPRTCFIHLWRAKLRFQIKLWICKFGHVIYQVLFQNLLTVMHSNIFTFNYVGQFTGISRWYGVWYSASPSICSSRRCVGMSLQKRRIVSHLYAVPDVLESSWLSILDCTQCGTTEFLSLLRSIVHQRIISSTDLDPKVCLLFEG